MAVSTINRMILWFDEAFRALSVDVSMVEVEQMAMLVHHSMDAKTRAFHTTRHVFGIGEGMKPLQVLAAIFTMLFTTSSMRASRRASPRYSRVSRARKMVS